MHEACEPALPIRPKLSRHAPAYEWPAHGRRLTLQLAELCRIFGGKGFGNRGEQLRRFEDGALEPAERGGERGRLPVAVWVEPEQPGARDPSRQAADIGADAPIALHSGRQAIAFLVGIHRIVHCWLEPKGKAEWKNCQGVRVILTMANLSVAEGVCHDQSLEARGSIHETAHLASALSHHPWALTGKRRRHRALHRGLEVLNLQLLRRLG